jgi:hypothetical protein
MAFVKQIGQIMNTVNTLLYLQLSGPIRLHNYYYELFFSLPRPDFFGRHKME